MSPQTATFAFTVGIAALFWLDRRPFVRTSGALWVPVIWLLIAASRPVSVWLQLTPPQNATDQYLEGSPLDRFVFATLMIVALIVLIKRGSRLSSLLRSNWVIVLFFTYCAISIFWSDYAGVAFRRWVKSVGDPVMVLVVLTDADPGAAITKFLKRVSFLLIPLSVLLIKYYPDLGRGYSAWTWTPYYTGVTTGKNLLGVLCLISGVLSVWRILQELSRSRKDRSNGSLFAHSAIVAMVLWLFSKANSVTPMSCFFMATALLLLTRESERHKEPIFIHSLVAAFLLIAVVSLFFNPGGEVLEQFGRDATLTGRTDVWKLVLTLRGNSLVGTGFESFWLGNRLQAVQEVYIGLQEAHNGYLEIYLNLGLAGILLLSMILITSYKKIASALCDNRDEGSLRLAYFVAIVIYSITEAGFRMLAPTWIVLLLVVVGFPKQRFQEAAVEPESDKELLATGAF